MLFSLLPAFSLFCLWLPNYKFPASLSLYFDVLILFPSFRSQYTCCILLFHHYWTCIFCFFTFAVFSLRFLPSSLYVYFLESLLLRLLLRFLFLLFLLFLLLLFLLLLLLLLLFLLFLLLLLYFQFKNTRNIFFEFQEVFFLVTVYCSLTRY